MKLRNVLLGVLVASSFGAISVPAQAEIIVRVAPPAPRYEVTPPPRNGYTWAPGYYRWSGHHHVWTAGHWERNRAGYVYRSPTWEERNGHYVFRSHSWDRDGDGVPNSLDRRPDNPNRS